MFADLGVFVVQGYPFLGGFFGTASQQRDYVQGKVDCWKGFVKSLVVVARRLPHPALLSLVKSLQCEWVYNQRIVGSCKESFDTLRKVIANVFLPALFDRDVLL